MLEALGQWTGMEGHKWTCCRQVEGGADLLWTGMIGRGGHCRDYHQVGMCSQCVVEGRVAAEVAW